MVDKAIEGQSPRIVARVKKDRVGVLYITGLISNHSV